MTRSHQVTGHQPVEPDRGPEQDAVPPLNEPGPARAPQRKHHDPEDPGFDDAD